MTPNQFKRKVKRANISAIYNGRQISAVTSLVPGATYAFHLIINNVIVKKIFYQKNLSAVFKNTAIKPEDICYVRIFYKYNLIKVSKQVQAKLVNTKTISPNVYKTENIDTTSLKISFFEITRKKLSHKVTDTSLYFKPREDCQEHLLTLPINWIYDPFNDRNWMFQLQAWRMLDPFLNEFNHQNAKIIQNFFNDWLAFAKRNKHKWLWYDMAAGIRALKISFYLLKCKNHNIAHGIEDIEYLIDQHLAHLSNPKELSKGNHGLFQLHGLKALLYILKDFATTCLTKKELNNYVNQEMEKLIFSQLGEFGIHTENSPSYHFFAHRSINNIVQAPWWNDLSPKIYKLLQSGEKAKPWFLTPDDKCVPVGDSSMQEYKNLKSLITSWPHQESATHMGARLDGYAVVRSKKNITLNDSSYLFFQGSFYSTQHKHADDLSVILQEKGDYILIDSGKYGYQKNKFRNYFISTRAHNTVMLDNKSTCISDKCSYGSALINEPTNYEGIWVIKGHVNHIENQFYHKRLLVYSPGNELLVVDKIVNYSSELTRQLTNWWNLNPCATQLTIESTKDLRVSFQINQSSIKMLISSTNNDLKAEIMKGFDGEYMAGWISTDYLKAKANPCLRITSSVSDKNIILTHFKLSSTAILPEIKLIDQQLHTDAQWLAHELNVMIE